MPQVPLAAANTALPQRPFGHAFDGSAGGGAVGRMNGCSTLVCSVWGGGGNATRCAATGFVCLVVVGCVEPLAQRTFVAWRSGCPD